MTQIQGAFLEADGVRFRLWAPGCASVSLVIEPDQRSLPMQGEPDGFFSLHVSGLGAGALYRYRLPDGMLVPDPASRFQPQDVHGPSEVVDQRTYAWAETWQGRPASEIVLYELHVGAFTREGTFRAAIGKLDHLADLGVTAIEIMPIADFPGRRNWGYDGVLPYAPDSSYGRPDDFKALVEAAHARGIAVLLDVVYNHFGPDGNYLPCYAPAVFTERHHTPWGAAINYDGKTALPVREFVIGSALAWIEDYHLDGLRFDAVHAIIDDSETHLLDELALRLRAAVTRPLHLLLENEENDSAHLVREGGRATRYTAQWNDDVHHVLHTAATHETAGYYADYEGKTDLLGRALAEGFAYQGEVMPYRGSARGEASAFLPPGAFVAFIQNHDQIGNRAFGDRLGTITDPAAMRALAATYLLLPQIPMIFMGEEFGATTPFPFFCDFEGELADAVRNGRREEFSRFPEFQDPEMRERIPDPQAETTFDSAKLDWAAMDGVVLSHYRALLAARRQHVEPLLAAITRGGTAVTLAEGAVEVRWQAADHMLVLSANLSGATVALPAAAPATPFWTEGSVGDALGPWSVRWAMETA